MAKIDFELRRFIKGPARNTWLQYEHMHYYVRKGHHALNHKLWYCLDVAGVEVKEDHRGAGIFTRWLSQLEKYFLAQDDFEAIYIECVVEPRFAEFFRKRGYSEQKIALSTNTEFIFPNFYILRSWKNKL